MKHIVFFFMNYREIRIFSVENRKAYHILSKF